MFDAFYDRYDITDELLGATGRTVCDAAGASSALFGIIYESACWLGIKAGIMQNDDTNHADLALMYFLAAAALTVASIVMLAKSLISLATRTIVTCIEDSQILKKIVLLRTSAKKQYKD